MDQKILDDFIALIIVRHPKFNNVYQLIKISGRYFGVFPFSQLTKSIIEKGYVNAERKGNLDYYTITPVGEKFIADHYDIYSEGMIARAGENYKDILLRR